jgi:hypothetical protein
MRQVAGEPEELELKREHERLERRLGREVDGELVEEVEKARQAVKGLRVWVMLEEEPEHRLEPDLPYGEAVRVGPRGVVRTDEIGAGDSGELSSAFVKEKLDVAQRLQPGAESRLRTAHPLRDRAEAAPVERVEVKNPVGLPESERPEDDRLGLDSARRHVSSVISRREGDRDVRPGRTQRRV